MQRLAKVWDRSEGSALLEFALVLPLLVVFIVGIYDFSGAYNQKQKIEHAAQSGAIIAAGQPTGDMEVPDPASLLPVATVIFNSLVRMECCRRLANHRVWPPLRQRRTAGWSGLIQSQAVQMTSRLRSIADQSW